MKTSRTTSLILAGVAAAAVLLAPTADAQRTWPTCQPTAATAICDNDESTSITLRPATIAPQANKPVIPWLGTPGAN